jgi:hypothetical protein
MDPITIGLAFSAAQAAVKGIKEAIKLGKDVGDITHELGGFFKHSNQVREAAAEAQQQANNPDCTEDITMLALDLAFKEKKLRDDETALKDMIIYEMDAADVWFDMIKKRDAMMGKRRAADEERLRKQIEETLARNKLQREKQRNRERLIDMLQTIGTVVTTAIVVGGALSFGLWWAIINYGQV